MKVLLKSFMTSDTQLHEYITCKRLTLFSSSLEVSDLHNSTFHFICKVWESPWLTQCAQHASLNMKLNDIYCSYYTTAVMWWNVIYINNNIKTEMTNSTVEIVWIFLKCIVCYLDENTNKVKNKDTNTQSKVANGEQKEKVCIKV